MGCGIARNIGRNTRAQCSSLTAATDANTSPQRRVAYRRCWHPPSACGQHCAVGGQAPCCERLQGRKLRLKLSGQPFAAHRPCIWLQTIMYRASGCRWSSKNLSSRLTPACVVPTVSCLRTAKIRADRIALGTRAASSQPWHAKPVRSPRRPAGGQPCKVPLCNPQLLLGPRGATLEPTLILLLQSTSATDSCTRGRQRGRHTS